MSKKDNKKLIILGAGNSARHVARTAELVGFHVLGFTCSYRPVNTIVDRWNVLGPHETVTDFESTQAAISVSDPIVRRDLHNMLIRFGIVLPNIVHPSCLIYDSIEMGVGCIFHGFNVLCYGCKLGDCIIMDPSAHFGNDNSIGSYCTISPGARTASKVCLENGVTLGINSSILPNMLIGAGSIIGGGGVVTKEIPRNSVAAGVPARVINDRKPIFHESSFVN